MRGRAWVRRIRVMVTLIGLIALLIDLPGPASPLGSGAVPKPAARQQLVDMYGRLPMHFEANLGRTDPSVQFLARGRGYGLLLTSTEVRDWDADGDDTAGLYSSGASTFFLKNTNAAGAADLVFGYGPPGAGWTPLAGDWDGD